MLFTSLPQLIVLVILFFGGLILGLGLHPGGKKWRERFMDESDHYAQYRRGADHQIREANRRIGELEREASKLRDGEGAARKALSESETRRAAAEAGLTEAEGKLSDAERKLAAPPPPQLSIVPSAPPPAATDLATPAPPSRADEEERPGTSDDEERPGDERALPAPEPVDTDAERDGDAPQEPGQPAGFAMPVAAAAAVPAFPTSARTAESEDESAPPATESRLEPAGQSGPAEIERSEPHASPEPGIAAEPVREAPKKSWFSMGGADDLGRIRGIDPMLKTRLFGLGVTKYDDITTLSQLDEMALEQRLGVPAGFITREQWRDQAALLRAGNDAEHAERFPQR